MDAVEEIKAKLSIEELVGEYVQLKKAGRNFKALCPWHNDKNPSFVVSPDKGICWCFVCQDGGDVFKFIQKTESVDFQESLKILAERTGTVLPEYSGKGKEKKEEKQEVQAILESCSGFFQEQFAKNKEAQEYWATRNIDAKVTKAFEVGYAPDAFTDTFKYLSKQDFHSAMMVKSGMEVEKDDKPGEFFDRFRGRIMIPIKNHLGKIVGFGGRIVKPDSDKAKYLNSPESPLYSKSYVLFGLDKAKDAIKKEKNVVVLEGYMDVIASHQAGVKNVVAVSGTALTKEQLQLLKRYTDTLKLCFDQDSAGRDATKRSIELAAELDFNIEIVVFDEAKDSDELIQKGEELWKAVLENTVSSFEFYMQEAQERLNLQDEKEQKQFVAEILNKITLFPSVVVQQNYVRTLAEKCQVNPRILLEEFERLKKNKANEQARFAPYEEVVPVEKATPEKVSPEKYLLGVLFHMPRFVKIVKSSLIFQVFQDASTKDLYQKILDAYSQDPANVSELEKIVEAEELEKIRVWQLFAEEKNELFVDKEWEQECRHLVGNINKKNIQLMEDALIRKMKDPAATKDEQQASALKLIEINKLKKAL